MDTLMLVYKGKSSEDLYTASFDGRSWHGNTKIRDEPGHLAPQSDRGPGVAVYNNWLYLLYKGDSSNDLYTAWWDGKRWNGNLKISDQRGGVNPQSNRGPNLAVYKGLLFTVYKGGSHDDLYSAWFDGTTWYGDTRLEEQPGGISPESNHNPGMAVFDDKLYIVYKGASSDKLYLAWFDGRRWAGNVAISEMPGGISPKSDHRPSAISFDGKLYLVYKGASSSHLYTAWFDGSKWSGNTKIKEQPGGVDPESNEGPSAQIYDGKLYIVYKGASSDALYTAWFDGSTWRGNTKISEQPGGIDPESNHQPGVALAVNTPTSRLDWMRFLPDSLSIGQINVPGTHDSAAINTSIH
ncbi:MAG TPA: hypothetical protein VHQ65_17410, partial [Thermoanaerobaculia bacterium]|nr:hypothetical protein [Thermoanaerobaculia bacterium]